MKNIENLTIADYLAIFRRRIWYVVLVTLLVSTGAVAYALRLDPSFRSQTTIAISNRIVPEDYIRSIDRQTKTDQMDFVRQQLQSRLFIETIIREFHLAEITPAGISDGAIAGVGRRIETEILTANAFRLAFTATTPERAQAVTKRLAEKVIELNDSFRKETVQTADEFLESQLEDASNALSIAEERLANFRSRSFPGTASENVTPDSLRQLQLELSTVQTKLDDYVDERKSLERRLEETRQLKLVLKAPAPRPTAAPAGAPVETSKPTPLEEQLAVKRAEYAAALRRYTVIHPDVQRLKQEVEQYEAMVREARQKQAVVATQAQHNSDKDDVPMPNLPTVELLPAEIQSELDRVQRELDKTQKERNELAARVGSYQARLNPSPAVTQSMGELTRAYDAAKQRYTYLSEKKLNSEMAKRVDSSDSNEMFKIIDPANLPQKPIGPNRRLFVAVGSLFGFVFGLALAFGRDYMDPTLHSEEDELTELDLPVMTSVPVIEGENTKQKKTKNRLRLINSTNPTENGTFSILYADSQIQNVLLSAMNVASESYRLLQTRLLMFRESRPVKTILISSAIPNEGKTFTACCTAGILAQEPGKKVLLIDADLRTVQATTALGFANIDASKTLYSVLSGKAKFEDCLLRCSELNLYFIPSGLMSNASHAFNAPQLQHFLQAAAEQFDWIVVDSPPLLAVADANRMHSYCDALLLVINAGKTPTKLVKDSIRRVGHDRISGIIMNRVKSFQSNNYYYAEYYHKTSKQISRGSV